MSLLLWEYFWTEADWVAGSASATATVSLSTAYIGAGGGGHKKDQYSFLNEDFWEIRERYIKRFVEPTVKRSREELPAPAPESDAKRAARTITRAAIAQAKLRSLQVERDLLFEKIKITRTREDLQRDAAKILKISLDILSTNNQYYEQAAIILLLDVY